MRAGGDVDADAGIERMEGGRPTTSREMLLAYRTATLAVAAIGALFLWQSRALVYYTPYGPGPSFFPRWLGGLLLALALFLFVASLFSPPRLEGALGPPRGARADVILTLAAIIGFALLIERVGFALTVFPMVGLLLIARRTPLATALVVAALASFGVGYVFANHLGVALPRAPADILLPLGL